MTDKIIIATLRELTSKIDLIIDVFLNCKFLTHYWNHELLAFIACFSVNKDLILRIKKLKQITRIGSITNRVRNPKYQFIFADFDYDANLDKNSNETRKFQVLSFNDEVN